MKKFFLFLSIFSLIVIGNICFTACEKEEVIPENQIIKSFYSEPDYGYNQWVLRTLQEEGKCYVVMVCEPCERKTQYACSNRYEIQYVCDENGNRLEAQCNTPIYPFDDIIERTWEIEYTKEFISEAWTIFEFAHNTGLIEATPQELWENAPNR